MDANQWLLLAYLAKFSLVIAGVGLTGLCLVRCVFQVPVPRRGMVTLWAITACAALCVFGLTAGVLGGTIASAFDPFLLGIVWDTPVGTALLLRVIGLGLILFGRWSAALGAVLILGSFVVSGHVASLQSWWLWVVLLAHLLVAGFWVGIVWPLHALARTDAVRCAMVAERFGNMAVIAVPVMLIAGGIMAYVLVGSVAALWTTSYGNLLLIKVAGVSVVMVFAALNKLRFVPALQRGDAAEGFAKSLEVEGAAMIFVLAITAALTSFGGP